MNGKATLTSVATSSRDARVALRAGITVVSKPAHRKKRSRSYSISRVRANLAAGVASAIVLTVPNSAVSALSTKGDKLSATARLTDADHGDAVLKTVSIARI